MTRNQCHQLFVVQLLEELSQELEDLRSFKAEIMSKSRSGLPADFSQKYRKQLEAVVARLKQVVFAVFFALILYFCYVFIAKLAVYD